MSFDSLAKHLGLPAYELYQFLLSPETTTTLERAIIVADSGTLCTQGEDGQDTLNWGRSDDSVSVCNNFRDDYIATLRSPSLWRQPKAKEVLSSDQMSGKKIAQLADDLAEPELRVSEQIELSIKPEARAVLESTPFWNGLLPLLTDVGEGNYTFNSATLTSSQAQSLLTTFKADYARFSQDISVRYSWASILRVLEEAADVLDIASPSAASPVLPSPSGPMSKLAERLGAPISNSLYGVVLGNKTALSLQEAGIVADITDLCDDENQDGVYEASWTGDADLLNQVCPDRGADHLVMINHPSQWYEIPAQIKSKKIGQLLLEMREKKPTVSTLANIEISEEAKVVLEETGFGKVLLQVLTPISEFPNTYFLKVENLNVDTAQMLINTFRADFEALSTNIFVKFDWVSILRVLEEASDRLDVEELATKEKKLADRNATRAQNRQDYIQANRTRPQSPWHYRPSSIGGWVDTVIDNPGNWALKPLAITAAAEAGLGVWKRYQDNKSKGRSTPPPPPQPPANGGLQGPVSATDSNPTSISSAGTAPRSNGRVNSNQQTSSVVFDNQGRPSQVILNGEAWTVNATRTFSPDSNGKQCSSFEIVIGKKGAKPRSLMFQRVQDGAHIDWEALKIVQEKQLYSGRPQLHVIDQAHNILLWDWVSGKTLSQFRLKADTTSEGKKSAFLSLVEVLNKIVDADAAAGILHIDISPRNTLYDEAGRIYLVDGGALRTLDERGIYDATSDSTVTFQGTPKEYWAPGNIGGELTPNDFSKPQIVITALECIYGIDLRVHGENGALLPDYSARLEAVISVLVENGWAADEIKSTLRGFLKVPSGFQDGKFQFRSLESLVDKVAIPPLDLDPDSSESHDLMDGDPSKIARIEQVVEESGPPRAPAPGTAGADHDQSAARNDGEKKVNKPRNGRRDKGRSGSGEGTPKYSAAGAGTRKGSRRRTSREIQQEGWEKLIDLSQKSVASSAVRTLIPEIPPISIGDAPVADGAFRPATAGVGTSRPIRIKAEAPDPLRPWYNMSTVATMESPVDVFAGARETSLQIRAIGAKGWHHVKAIAGPALPSVLGEVVGNVPSFAIEGAGIYFQWTPELKARLNGAVAAIAGFAHWLSGGSMVQFAAGSAVGVALFIPSYLLSSTILDRLAKLAGNQEMEHGGKYHELAALGTGAIATGIVRHAGGERVKAAERAVARGIKTAGRALVHTAKGDTTHVRAAGRVVGQTVARGVETISRPVVNTAEAVITTLEAPTVSGVMLRGAGVFGAVAVGTDLVMKEHDRSLNSIDQAFAQLGIQGLERLLEAGQKGEKTADQQFRILSILSSVCQNNTKTLTARLRAQQAPAGLWNTLERSARGWLNMESNYYVEARLINELLQIRSVTDPKEALTRLVKLYGKATIEGVLASLPPRLRTQARLWRGQLERLPDVASPFGTQLQRLSPVEKDYLTTTLAELAVRAAIITNRRLYPNQHRQTQTARR